LLLAACAGGGAWWWYHGKEREPKPLVLYGNIDLRQVQLAFNNSERIAAVLVQEGERVKGGQVVARLDTSRLEPQVAQAEAQVAAQRQVVEKLHHGNRPQEIAQAEAQMKAQEAVVERLHHGSRPEEIAQARANVEAARADAVNARLKYDRLKNLTAVRLRDQSQVQAVSREDVDNAKAALDEAEAKLVVNIKALDLALAGPRAEEIKEAEAKLEQLRKAYELAVAGWRKEEIAQAEAQLRANCAQLAWLEQQLADTRLVAPGDAVVRSRLLEPGEMSSPQRGVLSLAITDPKWVRAYVSEVHLPKLHPGMKASVQVDAFPGRRFEGWIGFISPVAEFTPKAVQTEELRTSLVFEVRVFVKDPRDELRLGLPATVYFPDAVAYGKSAEPKR
jgi:HlyD family secretion protein